MKFEFICPGCGNRQTAHSLFGLATFRCEECGLAAFGKVHKARNEADAFIHNCESIDEEKNRQMKVRKAGEQDGR